MIQSKSVRRASARTDVVSAGAVMLTMNGPPTSPPLLEIRVSASIQGLSPITWPRAFRNSIRAPALFAGSWVPKNAENSYRTPAVPDTVWAISPCWAAATYLPSLAYFWLIDHAPIVFQLVVLPSSNDGFFSSCSQPLGPVEVGVGSVVGVVTVGSGASVDGTPGTVEATVGSGAAVDGTPGAVEATVGSGAAVDGVGVVSHEPDNTPTANAMLWISPPKWLNDCAITAPSMFDGLSFTTLVPGAKSVPSIVAPPLIVSDGVLTKFQSMKRASFPPMPAMFAGVQVAGALTTLITSGAVADGLFSKVKLAIDASIVPVRFKTFVPSLTEILMLDPAGIDCCVASG